MKEKEPPDWVKKPHIWVISVLEADKERRERQGFLVQYKLCLLCSHYNKLPQICFPLCTEALHFWSKRQGQNPASLKKMELGWKSGTLPTPLPAECSTLHLYALINSLVKETQGSAAPHLSAHSTLWGCILGLDKLSLYFLNLLAHFWIPFVMKKELLNSLGIMGPMSARNHRDQCQMYFQMNQLPWFMELPAICLALNI